MGFDPVRDAILNSPTRASLPTPPEDSSSYAPTSRISPPGSVLVPVSQADLARFLLPQNRLRNPASIQQEFESIYRKSGLLDLLHSNDRKRPRDSEEEEEEPYAPPAKRTRDSSLVVEHCLQHSSRLLFLWHSYSILR
jgi:mRNA (guanine-N7-)-methyltransferase